MHILEEKERNKGKTKPNQNKNPRFSIPVSLQLAPTKI